MDIVTGVIKTDSYGGVMPKKSLMTVREKMKFRPEPDGFRYAVQCLMFLRRTNSGLSG